MIERASGTDLEPAFGVFSVRETLEEAIRYVPPRIWLAILIVAFGLVAGYLVQMINRRLLERAGVPETIEGTAFERTAREFGLSTVTIIAKLSNYFIVGLSVFLAFSVAEVQYAEVLWNDLARFIPRLFIAAVVLVVGVVIGDKIELYVAEQLRGIKLPETGIIPTMAKYSVVYVAVLIALGQIGVATLALIVLLAAYTFAIVVLTALATKDLLSAGAAGVFLLLRQPYGIGDEVKVANRRGIVQEVDLFVTHIETDGEEHILPNHLVFRQGIVRIRS